MKTTARGILARGKQSKNQYREVGKQRTSLIVAIGSRWGWRNRRLLNVFREWRILWPQQISEMQQERSILRHSCGNSAMVELCLAKLMQLGRVVKEKEDVCSPSGHAPQICLQLPIPFLHGTHGIAGVLPHKFVVGRGSFHATRLSRHGVRSHRDRTQPFDQSHIGGHFTGVTGTTPQNWRLSR